VGHGQLPPGPGRLNWRFLIQPKAPQPDQAVLQRHGLVRLDVPGVAGALVYKDFVKEK
jgi:hypothetical protein